MKSAKVPALPAVCRTAYCSLICIGLWVAAGVQAQTLTTLHSFNGAGDGAQPQSPLVLSGNTLYGSTWRLGPINNYGTVFSMNTDGTHFKTIYAFTDSDVDGNSAWPYGPLTVSNGAIYGAASGEIGTVFKVNTDGSGLNILHIFSGALDGGSPFGGVLLSGNTLYGAADTTVYRVNTDGTDFAVIHCVSCDTGNEQTGIYGGVALAGDSLYGTTFNGGSYKAGTIFKVNTNGTGFTTLHDFGGSTADGAIPWSELLLYSNRLYGTTLDGVLPQGPVVFAINLDGTGYTVLHQFTGLGQGWTPQGGLICANDTLYGATTAGDKFASNGVVYSVNIDGTGFKTLYSFTGGADGGMPAVRLTLSSNNLYGSTTVGGDYGHGTIFRLSLPFTPTPAAIVHSHTNMVVAWPAGSSGLILQSSTNLIDWVRVSQSPILVNGQFTVTNSIAGDHQFFRLSH